MSHRRRILQIAALLGVAGAALAGFLLWLNLWRGPPPAPPAPQPPRFPVPPYSASRFLNARASAHYIGVAACAKCHTRQHQSFLLTPHSRALGDPDLDDEPADGGFFHKASGRSYRVYRQDKTLHHEEVLRTPEGKEIARVDAPIRYRIGSGNFTRSYLFEIDGFLYESPITWYAAQKRWGMSPGYDQPNHLTFERGVELDCLACHAGRAEQDDGAVHRLRLHENVIGCENCHGPGSLHQELHLSGKFLAGQEDTTIVHPGKLPRPLLEAICSKCHLSAAASVLVRGRRPNDFRPGMPLTDYRVDYQADVESDQMTVVGHMEQLRRSVCYQKSPELTCLTCHDPHARQKPKHTKDAAAAYRQACLSCHEASGCRLDQTERLKKDATDNCVTCHMPRGDTDIPHIAFTHHRIGRHAPRQAGPTPDGKAASTLPGRIPELVPTDDVRHLPRLDQQRSLGMAYVVAATKPGYAAHAAVFQKRARELLEAVHEAGLRQPDTAAALAELYRTSDRERARDYAQQVLDAPDAPADLRANALHFLAACDMQERNFSSANRLLEKLVGIRRFTDDWRLLGMSYLEQDQPQKALAPLKQAMALRPFRPTLHLGLAEAYRRLGEAKLAQEHLDKGRWLQKNSQD